MIPAALCFASYGAIVPHTHTALHDPHYHPPTTYLSHCIPPYPNIDSPLLPSHPTAIRLEPPRAQRADANTAALFPVIPAPEKGPKPANKPKKHPHKSRDPRKLDTPEGLLIRIRTNGLRTQCLSTSIHRATPNLLLPSPPCRPLPPAPGVPRERRPVGPPHAQGAALPPRHDHAPRPDRRASQRRSRLPCVEVDRRPRGDRRMARRRRAGRSDRILPRDSNRDRAAWKEARRPATPERGVAAALLSVLVAPALLQGASAAGLPPLP